MSLRKGDGILISRGNGDYDYRQGSIGNFSFTDKMAERDPKTGELKIIAPSVIDKTNIYIPNKWSVIIKGEGKQAEISKPNTQPAVHTGPRTDDRANDHSLEGFGIKFVNGKCINAGVELKKQLEQQTQSAAPKEEETKKPKGLFHR